MNLGQFVKKLTNFWYIWTNLLINWRIFDTFGPICEEIDECFMKWGHFLKKLTNFWWIEIDEFLMNWNWRIFEEIDEFLMNWVPFSMKWRRNKTVRMCTQEAKCYLNKLVSYLWDKWREK
jgi:hypothetical protein